MAYVLPLGNRWALMRNLRCPKERKANEEWRLCVNLRNNLYINLHISFPRRNYLAEIRHSQRFYPIGWYSTSCVLSSTFRPPHFAFCLAKHGLSHDDPLPFEARNMVFRDTVRHVLQLERCLNANSWFVRASKIPQKWQFRSLVWAKSRHNFLTKNPNSFLSV